MIGKTAVWNAAWILTVAGFALIAMNVFVPVIFYDTPQIPADYNWCTTVSPPQLPWWIVFFSPPGFGVAGCSMLIFGIALFILYLVGDFK
jgi:hypothetical protein